MTRARWGSGLAEVQRTREARRSATGWLLAALAGVLYAWGIGHGQVQPYYTAAVRSMSLSWKAFFYGGLNPSAAITVDKIPGTFWLQALSVRLFGAHVWAVDLPQVLEGMAAVLVLHRVVREWAGQAAAALAALALALTPIVVALDRDNLPDTLLVLLLVLAAKDVLGAIRVSERSRGGLLPLLRVGLWVGLAFQAKMMQAWLILPALLLPYLVAAAPDLWRRIRNAAAACLLALAVSLTWVLTVALIPAADRPWIDGSATNNPFTMVFVYNGLGRFGNAGGTEGAMITAAAPASRGGWTTLVSATYAGQISWLLPLALIVLAAWLFENRALPRVDQVRAGYLLWGGWLLTFAFVFSAAGSMHGYYLAVLAPPICALFGGGLIHRWQAYSRRAASWWLLPLAIAASALWALYLGASYSDFLPFLPWLAGGLGLAAAFVLLLLRPAAPPERTIDPGPGATPLGSRMTLSVAAVAGVAALLISPAAWALSVLSPAYASTSGAPMAGPAGTLYIPTVLKHKALPAQYTLTVPVGRERKLLAYLKEHQGSEKYLAATQAASTAEPLLRAGSGDFLVLGGFTGLTPNASAAQFAQLVARDQVRYALLAADAPESRENAAVDWIDTHCLRVAPTYYRERTDASLQLYDCRPAG
ncbi:MAG TPA: glycosyltransferase family 39 protein [Actinospica sp.]|nr:glycosyltransferase family 39 protein [Actinospica sp.]